MGLDFWNTLTRTYNANDFTVVFTDKDWEPGWDKKLSAQIAAATFNLVSKTLTIKVRQTKDDIVQDLLFHLLTPETQEIDSVELKPMSGDAHAWMFLKGKLVDHSCSFAYGDSDPAHHTLVLQFEEIQFTTVMTKTVRLKRA